MRPPRRDRAALRAHTRYVSLAPTPSPKNPLSHHLSLAPGDHVAVGQPLIILEAMKMEHVLKAAVAGVVEKVGVAAGELVEDSRVCMVVTVPPAAGARAK